MGRFEFDQLLPRQVDLNDWHNIEIGVSAQGDRVGWNLHGGSNLLLVDPDKLSTGIIQQRIVVSSISRGHQMIHVDGGRRSGDMQRFLAWCAASPTDIREAVQTFRQLRTELERRRAILDQSIAPITVIIDGFERLTRQVIVPEWGESQFPDETAKIDLANQVRAEILDLITTLASEGRDQGIHIVLAVPTALVVSAELRTHFAARMLTVNPRTFPVPSMLGDVFPGIDSELTGEAREDALEAAQARGFALIASKLDPLTLIQVDPVRSGEVNSMLRAIGAVKPKQWKLEGDEGSSTES